MTDIERRRGEGHHGDVDDLLAGGVGADDSGPVLRLWQKAKSKRESQARRERVLAHQDLAGRLTEAPLRLSDPSRWSGWVPPGRLPEDACTHCERASRRCSGWPHRARVNDSPVRRQLVDVATDAMRRDRVERQTS